MSEDLSHVELSIVIPCLNEEKTLPLVLKKCQESLQKFKISGEIIVADNGSNDQSVKIAQNLGAKVVHVKEKGYGNALREGIKAAQGKYILMGDADDSYDFSAIDDFIKVIKEGSDLVMGTRLKGKIEKGAMPWLHRYLGTPVLTFLLNLLFKTHISDCNCGLRCFTKTAFEAMKLKSPGMEFASEMIVKAGLLHLKIKEIPINFYKDKRDKPPHLKTWSDGWRHLTFMFLYSPKYLFIIPGIALMMIGLLILVPLSAGPLKIAGLIFDYHSAILGGLFTILGYQTVTTGLYAKAFSYTQDFHVPDKSLEKFYQIFTLERGIILGLLLFLTGFAMNSSVLMEWIRDGYKGLNRASFVTAASTLMIIGMQTIFSSFFLSILAIKKK